MKRIVLFLLLLTSAPAFAQVAEGPRGAGPGRRSGGPQNRVLTDRVADDENAQQTERRLQELLRQYPPSLSRVLALDPTLLTNDTYLQPYPQLAAFLAQHPDVVHNPTFYFDQQYREMSRRDYENPTAQAIRAFDQIMGGIAALIMGLAAVFSVIWIIRAVIEHRKWLRVSKTHVETHAKLMDRLTSNEDLIAYMQSPAGKKFLEAAPIPLEGARRTLNAPFGRILWSLQAGLVVGALGVGLMFASERLASSDSFSLGTTPLLILGIAGLAVGIGFFVSALAAYGLSAKLGLFEHRQSSDSGSANVS